MTASFDLETVEHLLTTTRAVRKRLDLTRPVERDVLKDCIRLSQQAPTGSNSQSWRWMIVDDAAKRKALGEIYRRASLDYLGKWKDNTPEDDQQTRRVYESALYLSDVLQDVPVHVIPCINAIPDKAPKVHLASVYGSIFPAVWSFSLALRSRGLGSAITTFHLIHESEVAELLGIPSEYNQVALLPVAYTIGADFRPAKRPPVETILHFNEWS